MKRSQFILGRRKYKGIHPVYLSINGKHVGYVCERWGKGAGWFFRPLPKGATRTEWHPVPFKSASAAIEAMGDTL